MVALRLFVFVFFFRKLPTSINFRAHNSEFAVRVFQGCHSRPYEQPIESNQSWIYILDTGRPIHLRIRNILRIFKRSLQFGSMDHVYCYALSTNMYNRPTLYCM